MSFRITIILFGLLLSFTSCQNKESNIQILSVTELQSVMKKNNVQLIDVRTAKEFKLGHINSAELIDVKLDNFENLTQQRLDRNKPIYIYCRSGKRGKKACIILAKKGYKVFNLKGGYLEWKLKNKLNEN